MSAGPTAVAVEAGTAAATTEAVASVPVPKAGTTPPPASGPETVSVSAELIDRIVKRLDILVEMQRRSGERRPAPCRKCGGTADYSVVYSGLVNKKAAAHVCETCMEETVVHEGGMEIYPWKRDIASMKCVRCGGDVTKRGWCVCPRIAVLAAERGNGAQAHAREAGAQ